MASRPLPRAVPFVGRAAELLALAARFDQGARLVTLLGPGGIGKTALAVEHALRRVAGRDRTALVFCDLSGARDAAAIVDALAIACDVEAGAGTGAAQRVGAALAARGEVVVVIDNFDGLATHAQATVGAWLAAAPEAELLVTSRDRLALATEVVVEIGPLDDAVGLLVAAAEKAGGTFALRDEDRASAREIVALLERVPLALEIVGARLPLLGAGALLERLRAPRELFQRDLRGGAARHESLDAAVAGSFAALAPHEQAVLAQLTVFRGGFTIGSVEAIVTLDDVRLSVLDVIQSLRARSLVRTRDAAAARFDLYASVRSYVMRALPGPAEEVVERHAAWFVGQAEAAADQSHRDPAARAWLLAEHENVLAVAQRVLGGGPVTAHSAEPALRALVALSPVLLTRGALASVAALAGPIVERTRDSGADPRLAARAMLLRGAMRRERGDVRAALKDLLGADTIARALGDVLLATDLRIELGRTLLVAGELAPASEHFDRAAQAFAGEGARSREAHALAWLAVATAAGPAGAAPARALLERAVALAAGDQAARGTYLVLLARACADADDVAAAKRALDDAFVSAARERDASTEAAARLVLGMVLQDTGDLARAAEALAEARDLFAVHGQELEGATARGHLGLIAREQGRAAEAYALLADAQDVAKRLGRADDVAYLGEGAPSGSLGRSLIAGWGSAGAGSLPRRLVRRGLVANADAGAREASAAAGALVVGTDGTWFRGPGIPRVGLERRRSLALLLDRLARERIDRPGETLAPAALFAAAWPGEKALESAAAHRVRVAIATLRKMGLRDAILTVEGGGGYSLAADLRVLRA